MVTTAAPVQSETCVRCSYGAFTGANAARVLSQKTEPKEPKEVCNCACCAFRLVLAIYLLIPNLTTYARHN